MVVRGFVGMDTERLRQENPRMTLEQVCRAPARCQALLRPRGIPDTRHANEAIQYQQRRNDQATRLYKNRRHRCII